MSGPMGGAIMETAVITEVFRTLTLGEEEPQVYFWRAAAGSEVGLVVEKAVKLIPVEVKLSATPSPQAGKGIGSFHKDFPQQRQKGYVVHPGDTRLSLSPRAWAWPFAEL
jgi:uncharacterized protein